MSHILNYLCLLRPLFRKCLQLLMANADVWNDSDLQSTDYQQYIRAQNIANAKTNVMRI